MQNVTVILKKNASKSIESFCTGIQNEYKKIQKETKKDKPKTKNFSSFTLKQVKE
jgi:hypothetical protein